MARDAEQPQDVSANRSDNSWETNNTNFPTVVYVNSRLGSPAAGAEVRVIGHVNTSRSDNIICDSSNQAHDNTTGISTGLTMVVPPGHDYKVNVVGGGIDQWYEQKLGAP